MKLKTERIEVELEIMGEGRPILLLHGLGLDHSIWLPMASLYQDQAMFIMPDLRGQGKSELGVGDGSLEQQADDMAAVLDCMRVEKAVLAGHSMGGYLALAFAERHPERLAALILVTSHTGADDEDKKQGRIRDAERIPHCGTREFAAGLAPRLSADADLVKRMQKIIVATPPDGLANVLRAIAARPDRTELFKQLDKPVMFIAGAQDQIVKVTTAKELHRAKPSLRMAILPDAGHMPMLESPLACGALIVSI
jgi:3-oxoadipate enol-lactonase